MKRKIKQLIKKIFLIEKMRKINFKKKISNNVEKVRQLGKDCIFIMATPCHGNLGDQAIVYSEYLLLDELDRLDQVVEIQNDHYLKYQDIIKEYIKKEDMIIIDGGGNLGTLWPNEDDKISKIIQDYKENKIIIFPQTCYYDQSPSGDERLVKNKKVYKNTTNLTIALRDYKSYEFCQKHFTLNNLIYMPDIVLFISNIQKNLERKDCLLCFREDLEKVVSEDGILKIKKALDQKQIKYKRTSTLVDKKVVKTNRNEELKRLWKSFSTTKLLLTDRLHGMIFAAITGTPCLAIDNKSKKVSGVYKWIEDLNYIKICSDVEEVIENMDIFYNKTNTVYSIEKNAIFFEKMKRDIQDD